jgi:hypothetical protein
MFTAAKMYIPSDLDMFAAPLKNAGSQESAEGHA